MVDPEHTEKLKREAKTFTAEKLEVDARNAFSNRDFYYSNLLALEMHRRRYTLKKIHAVLRGESS